MNTEVTREEARIEQLKVLNYMKNNPEPISILELWDVEEMQEFFKHETALRRRIRIMADRNAELVVGVGRLNVWVSDVDTQRRSVKQFEITEKGLKWLEKHEQNDFEEEPSPQEAERRRISALHNQVDVYLRNFINPYSRSAKI